MEGVLAAASEAAAVGTQYLGIFVCNPTRPHFVIEFSKFAAAATGKLGSAWPGTVKQKHGTLLSLKLVFFCRCRISRSANLRWTI